MSVVDEETEEPEALAARGDENSPQPKGRRRSLGKVRRELTEEELGSPGVQKMLLDEVDRLDGIEGDLKSVSEKCQATETKLAVANEKLKTSGAFDIISIGTIAIGSLLFGAVFSMEDNQELFWIIIVISLILVAAGIGAKVKRA